MKTFAENEPDHIKQTKIFNRARNPDILKKLASNPHIAPQLQLELIKRAVKKSIDVLSMNPALTHEAQIAIYNSIDFNRLKLVFYNDEYYILSNLASNDNLCDILQLELFEDVRFEGAFDYKLIHNRNLSFEIFQLLFIIKDNKKFFLANYLSDSNFYKNYKISEKIKVYTLLM